MSDSAIYRPGVRGWWAFAYRYSPRGADKREFVADFLRRARPSARLRQSEVERAFYQRLASPPSDTCPAVDTDPAGSACRPAMPYAEPKEQP